MSMPSVRGPRWVASGSGQSPAEPFELLVANAEIFEVLLGIADIVRIGAGQALPLGDEPFDLVPVETPGILIVRTVNHIAQGRDEAAILEPRPQDNFPVDVRHQFAFTQIGNRGARRCRRHTESDSLTGTADIEAEDEPRLLGRAAVDMRIDAKSTMIAVDAGNPAFFMAKSRSPYQ